MFGLKVDLCFMTSLRSLLPGRFSTTERGTASETLNQKKKKNKPKKNRVIPRHSEMSHTVSKKREASWRTLDIQHRYMEPGFNGKIEKFATGEADVDATIVMESVG